MRHVLLASFLSIHLASRWPRLWLKVDWDGLQEHPRAVSTVRVLTSQEVGPRRAIDLVAELRGHVVLLRLALVNQHDLAGVPRVVRRPKPPRHLLADLQLMWQTRRARL